MLHTTTVYPHTLAVLKNIMQEPLFEAFCLVGGTELQVSPIMLQKITWEEVKKFITEKNLAYLK